MHDIALVALLVSMAGAVVALPFPTFLRSSLFDQPPTYGRRSAGPEVDTWWPALRATHICRAEITRKLILLVVVPVAVVAVIVLVA